MQAIVSGVSKSRTRLSNFTNLLMYYLQTLEQREGKDALLSGRFIYTYSWGSLSMILYLRSQPTADGIVFAIEKTLCISGSIQFKPLLFKGQMDLFLIYLSISSPPFLGTGFKRFLPTIGHVSKVNRASQVA